MLTCAFCIDPRHVGVCAFRFRFIDLRHERSCTFRLTNQDGASSRGFPSCLLYFRLLSGTIAGKIFCLSGGRFQCQFCKGQVYKNLANILITLDFNESIPECTWCYIEKHSGGRSWNVLDYKAQEWPCGFSQDHISLYVVGLISLLYQNIVHEFCQLSGIDVHH